MIAFRSKQVTQLATAATTLAVAIPAGIQPGDVMLAWIYLPAVGSTTTITPPAGWTHVRTDANTSGCASMHWRLVDGTESGTYTFTWSVSARALVSVTAYTGTSPTAPIGHLHAVKPAGSGFTLALPAKTAAVDNSWFATSAGTWSGDDAGASFTIDEPTDVERSDDKTVGGTSGHRPALAVYDTNGTVARGSTHDRVVTVVGAPYTQNASNIAWWTDLISDETTGVGPIAFRGSATGHYSGSASTVNIDLDASYVQPGDLLIAVTTRNGGTLTPPAGFTRLQFTPTGAVEYAVWYKVANTGDPATATFVSATGSRFHTVGLVAYSGANASSPIGAWNWNVDVGTSTPTITTRAAGSWIFSAIFKNGSAASFANADGLDAERVEQVAAQYGLATYDSAREYAAASAVSRTLTAAGGGTGFLRFIAEIRPGVIDTGPSMTVNRREGAAWVEYPDATPKAWTGAEWIEAPGRYWDGDSWEELP